MLLPNESRVHRMQRMLEINIKRETTLEERHLQNDFIFEWETEYPLLFHNSFSLDYEIIYHFPLQLQVVVARKLETQFAYVHAHVFVSQLQTGSSCVL